MRRALLILGIIVPLISGGLAAATFLWWGLQPSNSQAVEKQRVTIAQGSSVTSIAEQLKSEGIIRSPLIFKGIVWKEKLGGQIQAGSFQLSPASSPQEIAQQLTKGSEDVWVTVKEGQRAGEIGQEIATPLSNFDATSEDFASECLAYEGYLFPETYLVPLQYNTIQMCKLLREQYGEAMTMEMREKAHADNFSEEEIIVLASIVEREARTAEDMKKVSGVLRNRLEIGMPLQVDATLQYIKGYNQENETWWPTPTAEDKTLDSPYNTYKNPGLPPGPISNPGINALNAAVYPTESENLYYISDTRGSGMYFAKTYEEHMMNIETHLK